MSKSKELCRICLEGTEESVSLFSTKLANSEILLAEFLAQITNLEFNEDDLHPKCVCLQCHNKLEDVLKLINQCKRSQEFLIDSGLTTTKVEDEDDVPLSSLVVVIKKESCKTPIKHNRICYVCNKSFKSRYFLKRHESKHKGRRGFNCKHCSKSHTTLGDLKKHVTNIHNRKKVEQRVKIPFNCTLCPKTFSFRGGLKEHMRRHTGEKPFFCSKCGKSYAMMGSLKYHERTHSGEVNKKPREKRFQCNVCEKKFDAQCKLKYHMRKHSEDRPFICQTCGATFKDQTFLKKHINNIHLRLSVMQCPLCGKEISTAHNLTMHLKVHSGERAFPCNTCGKSFTTKALVKRHERVHTGEKPFICEVCGKAFNQSNALKAHRRGLHKIQESNEVPGKEIWKAENF